MAPAGGRRAASRSASASLNPVAELGWWPSAAKTTPACSDAPCCTLICAQPKSDLVVKGITTIENMALMFFKGDSRTVSLSYSDKVLEWGPLMVSLPKLISFLAALVICALLGLFITRTDTGKAIRAVAKERMGARLVGIDVDKVFAISFGVGLATLGAAACLLMPIFYVSPTIGHVFVIVAFTVVVLGGMGSFLGAVIGGLIVGLTESFGGLYLGESLGQIGISLIFILILLLRPTGLFGGK